MKLTSARRAMALSVCTLALLGCEEFEGLTGANSEAEAEAVSSLGPDGPRTEIRDVERADVFSVTENGLWDGRPSLGGVWVAHPDVTDPERVKITNTKTGRTIDGALFRRERSNPGPRIQVSSDAASSLGMLAGQPAELKIIAVRQEEIEIEPQPLPIAAESSTSEATEAASEPSDESDAAAATTAAGIAAAADGQPAQRKGFWARFRDSLRNDPKEEEPLDATGGAATATASAEVPAVETETLDPVTTAAAAAITAAEAESDAPPSRPAAAASSLKNPFIQVGLFSQEENASAAAASLRQEGIVPQIRGQQSGNNTLWRVFVGPMTSTEDQAALLRRVRDLGYADAFLAPN